MRRTALCSVGAMALCGCTSGGHSAWPAARRRIPARHATLSRRTKATDVSTQCRTSSETGVVASRRTNCCGTELRCRRAHQWFEATARARPLPLSRHARDGTLGGVGSDRQQPAGAGPSPSPDVSEGQRERSARTSMMKRAGEVEVAQNHRGGE